METLHTETIERNPSEYNTETIGDLFYDTLADLLNEIGNQLQDETVRQRLKKASQHIQAARTISEPYTDKELTSSKHYQAEEQLKQRGGTQKIAKIIGTSTPEILQLFLGQLSEKISNDGRADAEKGRKKLAKELSVCASSLLESRISSLESPNH